MTPMTASSAQRMSTTAGVVTVVAGSALLAAPGRLGPVIGLTATRDARAVGLLDLALAPGLLFGRPRWPWLMARAAGNAATAMFALQRTAGEPARRNAYAFSALLVPATLADVRAMRELRRGDGP
jgi:hypothetical protein